MCLKNISFIANFLSWFSSLDGFKQVAQVIFPFIRVYKDGTIDRLAGTEIAPAGLDPETGVLSEDILIIPDKGVSARIYRPTATKTDRKLPLIVYYHGGGFFLSSTADPKYHISLNKIVADANIILVSVNYRLAPENPLPAAFEDAWDALKWVASIAKDGAGGEEAWLKDCVDFKRVFLSGDSCGANMANHLALKLKGSELRQELNIEGMLMIFPYYWGKEPIGVEVTDKARKEMVDGWWMFVCPSEKGCDDPLINPFTEGCPGLEGLAVDRVFIIVAEKDILKDRGKLFHEKLLNSGWQGTVELLEIKGEDHIFHIMDPNCDNAKSLFKRIASFINQD